MNVGTLPSPSLLAVGVLNSNLYSLTISELSISDRGCDEVTAKDNDKQSFIWIDSDGIK